MSETNLAWELADAYGDRLAADDRASMFVYLGAGDVLAAMVCMLNGMARQGITLDADAAAKLGEWVHIYERDVSIQAAVARIAG